MAVAIVPVPACFSIPNSIDGNPIQQLLIRSHRAPIDYADNKRDLIAQLEMGRSITITPTRPTEMSTELFLQMKRADIDSLPKSRDTSSARWSGDRPLIEYREVALSLAGQFRFKADDPAKGIYGLRSPQLGAVHSVLGYWTINATDPATVVMPTGTGKTDTMIALFCAAQIERLLIIVPSDTLRTQITDKFLELGILQEFEIVPRTCHRPVVGLIKHGFKTAETATQFADQCHVMVATPSALRAASPEARNALLECCSHLFVDEAHHVTASTWRQIRDEFAGKRVVQFTATPYREDGRHIGGRFLYEFPLLEAQRQGYFSKINYISVLDMGNHDRAIAERAVHQLRQDLAAGYDHLIMARVQRIGRARELLPIYRQVAHDLGPVILHSDLRANEQREALQSIRDRTSRIIICVDMLGEGFDLPALKVAAIHDAHKSLGVTLQFIGRFARTAGSTLGSATAVVGRPDGVFDPRLRRLYSEDADWNAVIQDLSEGVIGREQEVSDFEAAFGDLPEEVAMRRLLPKMSTVVYRVDSEEWDPYAAQPLYGEDRLLTETIALNERDGVAWFVRENRTSVTWGELRTVEEITHDLFVLYLDRNQRLLYINSSDNSSVHQSLADAVCGESATRITGENVYRVMHNISRLVPTNVGLLDVRNRSRRFSMLAGADVSEGFPVAEAQTKTQTNIFAFGFEEGNRVSIGASLKGRVWSYRQAATLKHWVDWCDRVGSKMIDPGISVDDIFLKFIRPESLDTRPELVPLSLEWPWHILVNTSDELRVMCDEKSSLLVDIDFEMRSHETTGPIAFRIRTADWQIDYELIIRDGRMQFAPVGDDATVKVRYEHCPLAEYLNKHGLHVFFEQDAVVVPPAMLLKPDRTIPPLGLDKLIPLDWTGIDLSVESQGQARRRDSIQARTIGHVLSLADWDIILDDDFTGEIADIVAMRVEGDTLQVQFIHCKWVPGGVPRRQVADLYEVCGQAQKSTEWRRSIPLLLQRLLKRQRDRVKRDGQDGFMKGGFTDLYALEEKAPMLKTAFTIAISQPGVTKVGVTPQQLALLASTDVYVYETAYASFEVYCSP